MLRCSNNVTQNMVVYEGWSLVRVVVRQGFYCIREFGFCAKFSSRENNIHCEWNFAKFSSREIFLPRKFPPAKFSSQRKFNYNSGLSLYNLKHIVGGPRSQPVVFQQ